MVVADEHDNDNLFETESKKLDKQKIIERIEKLMAMANDSSSPNEAAIALKRAQKLMEQHNISSGDVMMNKVTQETSKKVSRNSSKLPNYMMYLVTIIENAFECKAIFTQGYYSGTTVTFYGIGTDPLIAKYSLEVLSRQLKKARREYIQNTFPRDKHGNHGQKTKTRMGDSFAMGWVEEAGQKASAIRCRMPEEKSQMLAAYKKQTWGEISNLEDTGNQGLDLEAVTAGQAAARNIQLHHGVDGTEQTKIGAAA